MKYNEMERIEENGLTKQDDLVFKTERRSKGELWEEKKERRLLKLGRKAEAK